MKTLAADAVTVFKMLSLVSLIALANTFTVSQGTRNVESELIEAERLNAATHARSVADREAIKRTQASNAALIADLRARVEAVEAALKRPPGGEP